MSQAHTDERGYTFTADWSVPWQEPWRRLLKPLTGAADVRYLEIGVFEGRSLLWMMENVFTHDSARATAVDPCFMPYGERLQQNLAASGLGHKIDLVRGPAREHLRRLPLNSYDVAYVDGSHLGADVLHDLVHTWELLRVGGIMIIDDYLWGTSLDEHTFARETAAEIRPREAVDAFLRIHRRDVDVLVQRWQMVVRKRPPFLERSDVKCHGSAWFCSELGQHLYYWDTRELVLMPGGDHIKLETELADIVEERLRE
ncbi:MAG: class I SAM-dependent methyltransferase [Polyangiaceae bacterium]